MDDHQQVADDVTVIVPTVGRPTLERCLQHLAAGRTLPHEVLVVHQGTDAATASVCAVITAQGLPCRHLPFPAERGAARARNRGLERCTTPLVSAIDDDCLAERDWLENLVTELRRDPTTVVTGRILPGGEGAPSVRTDLEPRLYRQPTSRRDILYTGSMGAAMEVFRRIGHFDEATALLPAAEDNEWAYRALRAGVPIRYLPTVTATHLDWRDPAEQLDVERRYARGQGGFYGLHLRRGDPFIARRLLGDLVRDLRRLASGLVHRDRRAIRRSALRLAGLVRGVTAGLREGARGRPRGRGPRR